MTKEQRHRLGRLCSFHSFGRAGRMPYSREEWCALSESRYMLHVMDSVLDEFAERLIERLQERPSLSDILFPEHRFR